jgi:hypothetical protein
VDPGGRIADPWRSHRLALETLPESADGVLVIQDDALPVEGFVALAQAAIAERAGEMICLFAPGFRPITLAMQEAKRRHQPYATLPYLAFVPVVCIWYPAAIVSDLLDWADRRRCVGADDGIVARYVRERRRLPLVTVPCLVDHDDDVPSVRGGPRIRQGAHRRAALL